MKVHVRFALRKRVILMALLSSVILFFQAPAAAALSGNLTSCQPTEPQKTRVVEDYGRLPLYFIENRGQDDPGTRFYAQGPGQKIAFTSREIVLILGQGQGRAAPIRLTPVGMQRGVLQARSPQEARFNYLLGNDPKQWRTDVPTSGAVLYREAYPGIDLKFYGSNRQLEYDLIVHPGADLSRVKFRYQGIASLKVDAEGNLAVALRDGGMLVQKKPLVYQEINGRRVAREGRFKLLRGGGTEYGFEVASYDKQRTLVIDPVLVYSTYLGGTSYDYGNGIAVDGSGNAYIVGRTKSTNFPTKNPYQPTHPSAGAYYTVFITKLNASGNALVYSTYLGGSDNDQGKGIAVDKDGNACVTGTAASTDFPLKNPFQDQKAGGTWDVFITKLNAAGNGLIYSSYLGGTAGNEYPGNCGITVDGDGSAYVAGGTSSSDFPTKNPLPNPPTAGHNAFVTKISPTGALLYSTLLGGNNTTNIRGQGIALDSQRNMWLAGLTSATDFPLVNPYQSTLAGNMDAFVAKIKADGAAILYSTYLGGSGSDEAYGIGLDDKGYINVFGETTSTNFPTRNAFQPAFAGWTDAFLTRFTPDGKALVYSTYLGGKSNEYCGGFVADPSGHAYACGITSSTDFPTKNPTQGKYGGGSYDMFVTKLNPAGTPVFSTYLGGSGSEGTGGVATDRFDGIYAAANTSSANFPTVRPYQASLKGLSNATVTKFGFPAKPEGAYMLLLLD